MNKQQKPRIIYNDDSCTLRNVSQPHTVKSLSHALDYLKGTQVDCLCWCVGGQQLAYSWPSKIFETAYDLQAKGIPPNCGDENKNVMYSLYRQGIDYLPLLIQRAHDQELMFIASFRMNDTHVKSYPNSYLTSEFWEMHQHYRLWDVVDGKSYHNAALDYSVPEVRNRYRDAIAEVANNYDVDGIELDFTRSPYFFQPSEAWNKREILTQFVRDICNILKQIETQRKRALTLILRTTCLERGLTTAGIDLQQWIKERLAPILVISELTSMNNYNHVIEPWLSLCHDANILLYPSVESGPAFNIADFYSVLVRNPLTPRHDGSGNVQFSDDEAIRLRRAAAQNLLAQHPDGIAMFNFPCWLAESRSIMHTDPIAFKKIRSLLSELGSLDTLAGKDKKYTFYEELPVYVEANRPRQFHQTISFTISGGDISTATVKLRFRQIAEKNPHAVGNFRQNSIVKPGLLKYYLNDREIDENELKKTKSPAGGIPSGFKLRTHEIVELQISGSELCSGKNTLAFEMPHFPGERDPYIYIYELEADVIFEDNKN